MHSLSLRSIAVAIALAPGLSCASSGPSLPSDISPADFGATIDRLREYYHIPGLSGVVMRNDEVIWEGAYGQRNIASNSPATNGTLYHLASLTKPFAAAVAMQLVQEGRLRLEQPVSDFGIHLTEQDTVRVWHLMSHTSQGLPGSAFYYNGDRFGLLDGILQQVTGQSFVALFNQRIRRPLQLQHTAPDPRNQVRFDVTELNRSAFTDSLARGYDYLPKQRGNIASEYQTYFGTAAGLVSSPRDVALFVRSLNGTALLSEPSKARMFSPVISAGDSLPYAIGWFVQRYHGELTYWHYGLWTGTSTLIVHLPAKHLTFVLLANNEMLSAPFALGAGELLTSPFARAFFLAFLD